MHLRIIVKEVACEDAFKVQVLFTIGQDFNQGGEKIDVEQIEVIKSYQREVLPQEIP